MADGCLVAKTCASDLVMAISSPAEVGKVLLKGSILRNAKYVSLQIELGKPWLLGSKEPKGSSVDSLRYSAF